MNYKKKSWNEGLLTCLNYKGVIGDSLNPKELNLSNFCWDSKSRNYKWYDDNKGHWVCVQRNVFCRKLEKAFEFNIKTKLNDMKVLLDYIKSNRDPVELHENTIKESEGYHIYYENGALRIDISKGKKQISVDYLENKEVKDHLGTIKDIVVDKQKTVNYVENLNKFADPEYKDSFYDLFEKLAPKTLEFLNNKFNYQNKETIKEHTINILKLTVFCFLKNFTEWEDRTLDKLFLFVGPGGSGKSTLVNWLMNFVYDTNQFAGSVDTLGGRFESSYIEGKSLAVFPDEDLQSTLNADKSTAVVGLLKKINRKWYY